MTRWLGLTLLVLLGLGVLVSQSSLTSPSTGTMDVPRWRKYSLVKIATGVNGCGCPRGCWQVNGVLGPDVIDPAIDIHQAIPLFRLPARGHVQTNRIKSLVACVGPGSAYAGLGVTGSEVFFRAMTYDIQAAPSDANFSGTTADQKGSTTVAPIDVVAYIGTPFGQIELLAPGCAVDYWIEWAVLP